MENHKVPVSHQLGYGIGVFGYGLTTQMISSYLVFYGTAVLYLPGGLIGFIVALSVLWDAVSDPVMGYISDGTQSKWGKRHPYLLIGTLTMALGTYFLWTTDPNMSAAAKFTWIFLNVMMLKTFITIYITPFNALGAEMTTDYDGRSSIQAVKTVFFLLSILSVTAISMFIFFIPTEAYPVGQLNPTAYRNMALTIAVITLITGAATLVSTRSYRLIGEVSSKMTFNTFLRSIKIAWMGKDYRSVVIGYLFTNLASALIGTIGLHIFTFTFLMDNVQIGMVFTIQILVSIVSQPFWISFSKRFDKKNAIIAGLYISITASIILMLLVFFRQYVHDYYQLMFIYSIVVGFGTSGLFSLPFSMIADTVDLEEHAHGKRNEGVYYGLINFGYKISQSLAILLFGILLDLIGFDAQLSSQANRTVLILGLSLPTGSLIAFFLARVSYHYYTLDREILKKIQQSIKQKQL
jgi:Na+/melibiose symporter-like transporter